MASEFYLLDMAITFIHPWSQIPSYIRVCLLPRVWTNVLWTASVEGILASLQPGYVFMYPALTLYKRYSFKDLNPFFK